MALGKQDLRYINDKQSNISGLNQTIKDCWNTFQYVTRSLEEWADETVIGSEIKANSQKLSDTLKQISDQIDKLQVKVARFEQQQRAINQE